MANRKSRKSTKNRRSDVRKPELHKPQVLPDGTPKPRRSQRVKDESRPTGPLLRIRPDGAAGLVMMSLCGWLLVAVVALGALAMHRWFTYGFPESLWLFVTLGSLAATPAVAYVARWASDIDIWALQGAVVAAGALLYESAAGPNCPEGIDCSAFGAAGSLTLPGALVVIALSAVACRVVGLYVLDRMIDRRRVSGRVSLAIASTSEIVAGVVVTLPLALLLIAGDATLRKQPAHVQRAISQVDRYCFSDFEKHYDLAARPDPQGVSTFWTTYLVRRADETRPPAPGKHKPGNWLARTDVDPYEAIVGFDAAGEVAFLQCRKVSPLSGKADAHDYETPDISAENPIKPQDVLQAPSTPTPAVTPTPKAGKGKAKAKATGK